MSCFFNTLSNSFSLISINAVFFADFLNHWSSTVLFITIENISASFPGSGLTTLPYFWIRSPELEELYNIIAKFKPGTSTPCIKDLLLCTTPQDNLLNSFKISAFFFFVFPEWII